MRTRRGLILLLPLVVAVAAAAPAAADDEGPGAYIDDNDNPTAVAHDVGEVIPVSSGGAASDCHWEVKIDDDWAFAVYEDEGSRVYSETGRWLERVCDGATVAIGGSFLIPEGGQVDPAQLAADARQSVPIVTPTINTSPASDRRLYVRVPTWLWLDPSWWQTYSATASAGRVTSTVTARPVRAVWSAGDGGGTTCDGPGVVWRQGMREDATYCSHTYRHSSSGEDGGTYTLSVTVEFEITWTSNVGAGGTLAGISRSASRPVEVGEIEAVESE